MAIIESTRAVKTWIGDYSFAVDGGTVTTHTLRSESGPIPTGAVVTGGYLDVTGALASSGSATAALQVEGANDTINAAAFDGAPWSTTGRKDIIPDATGSTALKATAARSPALVIGGAALTGGIFRLTVFYV